VPTADAFRRGLTPGVTKPEGFSPVSLLQPSGGWVSSLMSHVKALQIRSLSYLLIWLDRVVHVGAWLMVAESGVKDRGIYKCPIL
jgi:hypothetical protein